MSNWKSQILTDSEGPIFTRQEYRLMTECDMLPRVMFGRVFQGFFIKVDTLMETVADVPEPDDEDKVLIKELLAKLEPFKGKCIFIP